MSKKALCVLYMPLLFYIFLFPARALESSCAGVTLWFETILPTLLPFLILTQFLFQPENPPTHPSGIEPRVRTWFGHSPGFFYAWILGILCGYPMGARISSDLLTARRITRQEAEIILDCANQCSPVFLLNYVCVYVLQMNQAQTLQFFLLFYGSVLIQVILFSRVLPRSHPAYRTCAYVTSDCGQAQKEIPKQHSAGMLLDISIMNGFETITRLGGYIILFSIYGSLIQLLTGNIPILQVILSCFLELTSGLRILSAAGLPPETKMLLALCASTFGGISTLFQTYAMIHGSSLSIRTYLTSKITQTIIVLCEGLVLIIL